jgi:Ca-activated chloride channel family protein
MESAAQKDQGERYLDSGWYLVPLLALAAGFWFRRGWTIRWATALFVAAFLEAPAEAADWSVADLFATRDQQGRRYFERGDFKSAAERFEDPHWKGVACYRAGDFACAIDALARVDTPEAWYDLGNAYAKTGELKLALAAYDKALARRPGFPDAKANRDLVASKIPSEKRDPEPQGQEPSQKADAVKVDVGHLTDEQIAQMWLRGVQTSPAEFLRLKFASQARDAKAGPPLAGSAPR